MALAAVGLLAVGVPAARALAVPACRLATYWLAILPGWLSFRHLRRIQVL